MSKIFAAIAASVKSSGKVAALVRAAMVANDTASVTDAAQAIEDKFPVNKGDDGKDSNRDTRNDYLRTLRMALMRVGRELGQRLTIKKIEGVWQVVVEPIEDKGETEGGEGGGEGEGGEAEGSDEAKADALWSAVELVLANLDNAAVLSAIHSGLSKLAKSPKN